MASCLLAIYRSSENTLPHQQRAEIHTAARLLIQSYFEMQRHQALKVKNEQLRIIINNLAETITRDP